MPTMCYELQPLDTTQQTQFIISYSGPDGTSPEKYIKTCNQLTNEKGWDLFRLPEQCRLIADVFQDLSVQQHKNAPDRTQNKLNEDFVFAEIYGLHTINIVKKYGESTSDGALKKDDLQYQLMFEAIQKLFPGWTSPFQKLLKKQDFITGLMDSNSAAFLVSGFIIQMILEESSNALREDKHEFLFTEFLWNNLTCVGVRKIFGDHALFLYEFKHPVITHLLNDMIASIRHVDQRIIESLQETTTSYRLKQLAIACCCNNFANLLQFILARRPFEEHDYNVFDEVSMTNVELFGNLLGKYVEHRGNVVIRDISIRPGVSLLQAAVARGDIAIVNYLLGPHDFDELVRIGKSKSCQVIQQKREILQLHSLNGELLSEKDKQGCKPIVSPIETNLGADLLAGYELNETILHIAAGYMSASDYNKLVEAIPSSAIGGQLKGRPDIRRTPLHCVLQNFNPLENTLKTFKEYDGIDINATDENGENIIDIAIKMTRSPQCISNILECVTENLE
ncbi:unnamed protein product [Orchesella dallaii]|uniref:Uncharacterized protein n=1 Tax=Orchesella dallaii TaxID=48710 RepID=A0ABP1RQM7_9HEXA